MSYLTNEPNEMEAKSIDENFRMMATFYKKR